VETTLFRVVQQSLTNIHRHSGRSTAPYGSFAVPPKLFWRPGTEAGASSNPLRRVPTARAPAPLK